MAISNVIQGEDSRETITPIYCYSIRQPGANESFYLTSWPDPISIAGIPASWDADDPQVFVPAQIQHGEISRKDGIDRTTFDVNVALKSTDELSRYTLFGAIPKIKIDVFRISPGPVYAGDPAIFGRDTSIIQSGVIADFSTEGSIMRAVCCPEPFLTGHQVPRCRFTRTCNRKLYGTDCGVDREDFKLEANILSMDYTGRTLVISGQRPLTDPEDYFRQGYLEHAPTGTKHSIFRSEYQGTDTRIFLHQWFPDFAINDVVTAFAGCRHTADDCKNKFDNVANFGGFPFIPNVNPALHGVS